MNDFESEVTAMLRRRAEDPAPRQPPVEVLESTTLSRPSEPIATRRIGGVPRWVPAVAAAVALVVGTLAVTQGSDKSTVTAGDDENGTPTTATTASTTAPKCSASGMEVPRFAPGPSVTVSMTRDRIVKAAISCDYDTLQTLTGYKNPDAGFTYTYGDGGEGPAAYWRDLEAQGEPVMRRVVQTFGFRSAQLEVDPNDAPPPEQTVWPAVAATSQPTEADWDDLRPVYGDQAVDEAIKAKAWYGYRAGINAGGIWIYFVAGD